MSSVASSAGPVTLSVIVDGEAFPYKESGERLFFWTNLHRTMDNKPIQWKKGTFNMLSEPLTIDMELHNEYEGAEMGTQQFAVNGKLPKDATIWFEAVGLEPGNGNVGVLAHAGTGGVSVLELMKAAEKNEAVAVPMFLCSIRDPATQKPLQRGALAVKATFHDEKARSSFVHRYAPPTHFHLSESNMPLLSSIMQSEVYAAITPFMDKVKKLGVAFTETQEPDARIISPWRDTVLGQIWPQSFIMDDRASNQLLASEEPMSESYLMDLLKYAAKRHNWTIEEMNSILETQRKQKDATFDDNVIEALAVAVNAMCIPSTSLPYKSDEVDMVGRRSFVEGLSNSDRQMKSVESYDDFFRNGGGDCEDGARGNKQHVDMVVRGKWNSSLLQNLQFYFDKYAANMNLGSVTSPKVETTHAESCFDTSHNISKIRAHLNDAEVHHDQIEAYKACGAPEDNKPQVKVSKETAEKHQYVKLYPPPKENLGGHSWCHMTTVWSFAELVRRAVPDVDVIKVFGNAAKPGSSENEPPWTHYLREMVLEGTADVYPLLTPAVDNVVNGDRDKVRVKELQRQRAVHAVVTTAPSFKQMRMQMKQSMTVNVPNTRLTSFYRQTVQVFTDKFLDSTGGVAAFSAVRTHKIDEDQLNDDHDPLRSELSKIASHCIQEQALHMNDVLTKSIPSASPLKGGAFGPLIETLQSPMHIEAEVLGAMVGVKTLLTAEENDAVKKVQPENLTLGIDLEERLEWPLCDRIALVPAPPLSEIGAHTLRAYQRHLPPFVIPSKRLPLFATLPSEKACIARVDDDGSTKSTAMAKLVKDAAIVDAQRNYVLKLAQNTKKLYGDRPFYSRKECDDKQLVLMTSVFSIYDLVSDEVCDKIIGDLTKLKDEKLVFSATFHVEEPFQNVQNGVFRLQCIPPPELS